MLTAEAPAPLDTKRWVGQRFTCSVESGVRVHRPGACVTATTALDYASRDCRHVELDPCHMTPGRVVRHHCRHDTSRCRTTPPSYDTSRCRTTLPSYDTSGPSCDTAVVRHFGSVMRHHRRTTPPGVVRHHRRTTPPGVVRRHRRTTPPGVVRRTAQSCDGGTLS